MTSWNLDACGKGRKTSRMSEFKVNIEWTRETPDFKVETYSRQHRIQFNGGVAIQSSAPAEFAGDAKLPNPEELLASALGSCFMLTVLAVSARGGFTVDKYEDHPVALLEKNANGKMAVTQVTLRPKVTYSGTSPDPAKLSEIFSKAHANCMIANSVSAKVVVQPA